MDESGGEAPERVARLPCWRGLPRSEPMAGGLSNEVWKVVDDAGAHVLRLGADQPFHHVCRRREQMTARAAHAAGFAPRVEWTAPEAMVTQFVTARTWTPAIARAQAPRLAALLRDFHECLPHEVSGAPYLFWPFQIVRDYARTLREAGSRHVPALPGLLALNRALESRQGPQRIVFGHNDALPANILDDGRRLWLVDYEYAGFSTPLFDLAWAASNAGMDEAEAAAFLAAYHGSPPDAELLRAFDAMTCAALLREAMWAMVSAIHLTAPGLDFDAYAGESLGRLDTALAAYGARHGGLA